MAKRRTISLYWKCQLAGWSITSAYWALTAYIAAPNRFLTGLAWVYFIFDVLVGIAITHLYRLIADINGWVRLPLKKLAAYLVPAMLLAGVVYMALIVIKNYYARLLFGVGMEDSLAASFRHNWLPIFVTGIRLMAIWMLAFHLYHFARLRIESTRESARLQIANREAALNNLSAQLNPHFFFNALNTIKSLVSSDPRQARRAVDLLSELIRESLYRKENDLLIPLQEEISLVNDYLELEKIRLEHRLVYAVDVPDMLLQKKIPRWCIQTLVENAVKHGIAKTPGGGEIFIRIHDEPDALCIMVENPGLLSDTSDLSGGIGLTNLKERLCLHYRTGASVMLCQAEAGTVQALLRIPFA